jgi:sugar phosphate isomerase/epimerase
MRLAGHTLGTPEQTLSDALELFAAAGLEGAEVIYQDGYRSGLPLRDRRSAEEARRASEDLGVPIVGITPYTTGINALGEGQWRAAVDEFRGAIEIAQLVTFTHDELFEEALRIQGDLVGHVHVKDLVFTDPDAPFKASETAPVAASERAVRSRVVGDGVVPWGGIIPSLSKLGYEDVLSLEDEYRWYAEDLPEPVVGFARSAEALRACLAQVSVAGNAR